MADRRAGRALAGLLAVVALGGCATPGPPPAAHPDEALAPSFQALSDTIAGSVGVALVPVGGATVTDFGSWSSGVAWSTSKVPLAIAALRADPVGAEPLAVKAITASDNGAAEQLWSQLGPPQQAARQVQAVIAEGGDASTVVQARRVRPEFTAFGQTQWPLRGQARFAAGLPCIRDAGPVVELMGSLVQEQRWGLAADGAPAKAGWGPGADGSYLVRQFGIVTTDAGRVGVALAAEPADGTFASGVAALNRMAAWLADHNSQLPGGRCPG